MKNLKLLVFLLLSAIALPIAVVFLIFRLAWSFSSGFIRNINKLIHTLPS